MPIYEHIFKNVRTKMQTLYMLYETSLHVSLTCVVPTAHTQFEVAKNSYMHVAIAHSDLRLRFIAASSFEVSDSS
jgi:hypothetical protein